MTKNSNSTPIRKLVKLITVFVLLSPVIFRKIMIKIEYVFNLLNYVENDHLINH